MRESEIKQARIKVSEALAHLVEERAESWEDRMKMISLKRVIGETEKLLENIRDIEWKYADSEIEDTDEENERITEKFFEMLDEKKTFEEIKEATGVSEIEVDENEHIITIHYPNGEIISHWL